jgi:ketosteroid isomerase-like protein
MGQGRPGGLSEQCSWNLSYDAASHGSHVQPTILKEQTMGKAADLVKDLYAAFGRGDVAAVLGAFDAAIEWQEAEGVVYADGNPYVGPQAVAAGVFGRILADVDNFAIRPVNIIDGGDTVVSEGRYTGTCRATGTPLDAQFAHVWQVRDGKIVRFQQYTDTSQWTKAAGR